MTHGGNKFVLQILSALWSAIIQSVLNPGSFKPYFAIQVSQPFLSRGPVPCLRHFDCAVFALLDSKMCWFMQSQRALPLNIGG